MDFNISRRITGMRTRHRHLSAEILWHFTLCSQIWIVPSLTVCIINNTSLPVSEKSLFPKYSIFRNWGSFVLFWSPFDDPLVQVNQIKPDWSHRAFSITTVTCWLGNFFNNGLPKPVMLKLSISHLFRPFVHSWPLRTVIKVEQYVLTAARLHRRETGRERNKKRLGEKQGWDVHKMREEGMRRFEIYTTKTVSKVCRLKL